MLFMQHRVVFLLLNQHYALYLLIEKTAFAWYYVITARETNKNTKHKPKTKGEKNNGINNSSSDRNRSNNGSRFRDDGTCLCIKIIIERNKQQ